MVDNQPELFEDLRLAWDAWEEIATSREWRSDGAPTGIRTTEIESWLNLNELEDRTQRHDVYRSVRILDLLWLDLSNRKPRGRNPSSSDRSAKRKRR